MKLVETDEDAARLAELLNGNDRTRPVVVVSTPSGRAEPWIDARAVERELGDLAEVYLIRTGPHSWTFSEKMPAGTQVYGGAGRAYPLGHDWVGSLRESPLRFAYDAGEADRATQLLIDDALDMAAAAGLLETRKEVSRVRRRGVVKGIVADRALVDLGGDMAFVVPALAFHGVPLERVLAKGMSIEGWWDSGARWLDVRGSRRDPREALREYREGDVVLAVVHEVGQNAASVFLHPLVEVPIERAEVTSNDLDDLRDLMSVGEVLPVRVATTGAAWRLTLLDIDDDEPPRTAISLLEGGPAWLLPPVVDDEVPYEPPQTTTAVLPREAAAEEALAVEASLAAIEESLAAVEPEVDRTSPAPTGGPSPLLLDPQRHSRSRPPVERAPAEVTKRVAVESMSLTITKLKGQVGQLRAELDPMRSRLQGLEQENAGLAAELAELQRAANHQEGQLQHARARLRKAASHQPARAQPVSFADPEEGFRYAVLTAWARRTPLSEQAVRPLPDFAIGPRFLETVRSLEGVSPEKVADVVFEIVTDRAKDLAGRELHVLRAGEGGGLPQMVRDDGAAAWRAALQRNTASARRIHFWRLPDGSVELSRVVLHDDMDP